MNGASTNQARTRTSACITREWSGRSGRQLDRDPAVDRCPQILHQQEEVPRDGRGGLELDQVLTEGTSRVRLGGVGALGMSKQTRRPEGRPLPVGQDATRERSAGTIGED